MPIGIHIMFQDPVFTVSKNDKRHVQAKVGTKNNRYFIKNLGPKPISVISC